MCSGTCVKACFFSIIMQGRGEISSELLMESFTLAAKFAVLEQL